MNDRSAVDTIAGYFYQFDHSILSLMTLVAEVDTVALECIEDIDIHTATDTTAIQCKFYAQTEYNHSVIKPAIMLMLTHFAAVLSGNRTRVKYRLWGHFASGQHKLALPIDVDFLKKSFCSYMIKKVQRNHDVDLGLDDANLKDFLTVLTIDIEAKGFEQQLDEVIGLLESHFNCSRFQAEYFYYNNALRVIKELSISRNPADRIISKRDFLARIDTSGVLFGEWFVARKGKRLHLAALKREYFTALNVSPFERFFMVEINPADYIRQDLKDLVLLIAKKYSKLQKNEPKPFCPYVYIHGIDNVELVALKKELMGEDFRIVDGHDYNGSEFNPSSIQLPANQGNGVRLKILNSLADLETTVSTTKGKTRKLFQFHRADPFCDYSDTAVGHVKIQIDRIQDIKDII